MKEKLEVVVFQNVIAHVTVPTDWCSSMVIAPKRNGDVKICIDLTALNKMVKQEIHVDKNLAKLIGSKIFTELDANSGFWQIPLDKQSWLPTKFLALFGRFCFIQLPFGIISALEIFQRMMSKMLE